MKSRIVEGSGRYHCVVNLVDPDLERSRLGRHCKVMGHEVIVYKKRGEDMYSEEWWTQPDKTLKRVSRPDASGARAIKTPVQSDMRRSIRPDSRPYIQFTRTLHNALPGATWVGFIRP